MWPMKHFASMTYFDQQARFESMRRHAKKGHILQKHEDLRREYERLVRVYEREEKYIASRFALIKSEYLDKMKALESLDEKSPSVQKGMDLKEGSDNQTFRNKHKIMVAAPKLQRQRRDVLLFRVEKRDGHNVYVKTTDSQS